MILGIQYIIQKVKDFFMRVVKKKDEKKEDLEKGSIVSPQSIVDLLKKFEGCSLKSYQDTGGVWTVGVGHTGSEVHAGMTITQAQADALLAQDIKNTQSQLKPLVTVPLNRNQLDALTSFCFNVGCGTFKGSKLRQVLNQGDYKDVPFHLGKYIYDNGKVVNGLVVRRQAESALWSKPV